MAKKFDVYLETDSGDYMYMGSYNSKTFKEACRLCIEDNDLDPNYYNKKDGTYNGYHLTQKEVEEC